MATREERVQAAAAALKDAVMNLLDGERPMNPGLTWDFWRPVGKASIANWVDDAEWSCARIARALDLADAQGLTDEAIEEIEHALWRITAMREKLEAAFVLCFGVPSLEPVGAKSARFEPDTDGIKAKLRDLVATHSVARELGELGARLAEHPAVVLRNQLSHQLAAIRHAAELCWLDIVHLRGSGIIGWSGGPLYAEGVLDGGAITAEVLWERAVTGVQECFELLVHTFEVMAQLVRAAAVLEPPQRVYRDQDTGNISLTDPRIGA